MRFFTQPFECGDLIARSFFLARAKS